MVTEEADVCKPGMQDTAGHAKQVWRGVRRVGREAAPLYSQDTGAAGPPEGFIMYFLQVYIFF